VFLNIASKVSYSDEGGLLGLVFHPGFATNGYFYVFYYGPDSTSAGSGPHDILARYQVSPPNANSASAATEVKLLRQYDEAPNHNGGDLHFGSGQGCHNDCVFPPLNGDDCRVSYGGRSSA
jgi:glucose/arabinose dehydrogenase